MKKRILNLISVFLLVTSFSHAQKAEFDVWKLMSKKDGIEIYGMHQLCLIDQAPNDYHFLQLKIINTSQLAKEVSFYVKQMYQEGETGQNKESLIQINLAPHQSFEGSCSNEETAYLTRFIVNPKFKNSWNYIQSEIIFESIK